MAEVTGIVVRCEDKEVVLSTTDPNTYLEWHGSCDDYSGMQKVELWFECPRCGKNHDLYVRKDW